MSSSKSGCESSVENCSYTKLSSDATEFIYDFEYPKWSTGDEANASSFSYTKWSTSGADGESLILKPQSIVDCFQQNDESTATLPVLDGEIVNKSTDSIVPIWDNVSVSTDTALQASVQHLSSGSNLNKWISGLGSTWSSETSEVFKTNASSPSAIPWTRRSSTESPDPSWIEANPGDVVTLDSPAPAWDTNPADWKEDASMKLAEKLFQFRLENEETGSEEAYSNPRFKTEFCRNFREKGTCLYGDQCQFAHGKTELRQDIVRHSKYKTKFCQKFWIGGWCVYGPRCNFIHLEEEAAAVYKTDPVPSAGGLRPFQLQLRKNSESSTDSGIETFSHPPPDHVFRKFNKNSSPLPTRMQVSENSASNPPAQNHVLNARNNYRRDTNEGCGTLSEREKLIELVEALKLIERTDLGRDLLGQSDLARQLLGTSDLGRRIGQGLRLPGTGSPQDMKLIVHPEQNPNSVSAPAFDTWSTPQFFTG